MANSLVTMALQTAAHRSAFCAHTAQRANTQGHALWSLKNDNYRTIAKTSFITALLQVFIFNGNDVPLDLVLQHWLLLAVQQLVDVVDVGVS